MENKELTKLRQKLPHRYSSIISKNLKGKITPLQVQLVFKGAITNPEVVEQVVTEATVLYDKIKNVQSNVQERLNSLT